MARRFFMSDKTLSIPTISAPAHAHNPNPHGSLDADIIIKNAPDPVFVSDLEGKILSANDAVYELLGFRTDEVLEQSLSRFISPEETREFTAALREVIERGATRNARLNPRSASGEVIPTSLNASALRDADGKVIGAIGILRDMRELDKALAYADSLIKNAPDPVFVSDLEGKILSANDAVYELLGFRTDEVLEQSLSRFISPEETREFIAALREVIERGAIRNTRLNPRSASGRSFQPRSMLLPCAIRTAKSSAPSAFYVICALMRRSYAICRNRRPNYRKRSWTWRSSKKWL